MKLAELALERKGEVVFGTVRGDIDMSNADELRSEISAATPNDAAGLLLDLSEVRYLDSAGIRLIHQLREDLRTSGQRLKLVIPPGSVINATIRLAGLDWSEDTVPAAAAGQAALRAAGGP